VKLIEACLRKRVHKTKEDAEKHLLSLLADPKVRDPRRLTVYPCESFCGGWHVGHVKVGKKAEILYN
jgi:hypothetical protein